MKLHLFWIIIIFLRNEIFYSQLITTTRLRTTNRIYTTKRISTTNKLNTHPGTTTTTTKAQIVNGSCENPLNLFTELDIPIEGLLDYVIYNDLSKSSLTYKPSCSKYSYKFPHIVYSFRLLRTMYIDIIMSSLNSSFNLDCILALTDFNCTREFSCSDKSSLNNYYNNDPNDKSARIYTTLGPGYYKLITSGFFLNYESLFKLDIKFSIDVNFQYAYGSCKNPIIISIDRLYSKERFQHYGNLEKDLQQFKSKCSRTKSPSVVYILDIPNDSVFEIEIRLSDRGSSDNNQIINKKFDTVLSISNSICNNNIEIICNDDSDKIGGLSSFLSVHLTQGKYNLIASGYDNDTLGEYVFELFSTLFKVGNIDLLNIENSSSFSYNGSFSVNNYSIDFNCLNLNQRINRYIVIPLIIQNEMSFNTTIILRAADGLNKMDTFLEIRNKYFEPIQNFCNDDSKLIGGLSSRIDTLLTSGEYRIVLGALTEKYISDFKVDFIFKNL